MTYTAAWNTVVYCPRLKLSFRLDPWQYTPAPIPLFVLEPSVYQIRPPFSVVLKPPLSSHFNQGIWSWRVYHRHVSVSFYQTPSVGWVLFFIWAGRSVFDSRQGKDISLFHSVLTGSGVHSASYSVGTEVPFLGDKLAEAWSLPLTSI
jgi:hypothetical protein